MRSRFGVGSARSAAESTAALGGPSVAVVVVQLTDRLGQAQDLARAVAAFVRRQTSTHPASNGTSRVQRFALALGLTPRQAAVLERLRRGDANKDIAKALGCTVSTVETHMTRILRKAGVSRRAHLIALLWSSPDGRRRGFPGQGSYDIDSPAEPG